MTHKKRKKKFHVLNCWMFFFGAEGFSCSLGVLYRGLGISKLQFNSIFYKKNPIFSSFKFFLIFGHQNHGSRTGSESASGSAIRKNAGSASAFNQCGSAILTRSLMLALKCFWIQETDIYLRVAGASGAGPAHSCQAGHQGESEENGRADPLPDTARLAINFFCII
jgi:hypothetical protein